MKINLITGATAYEASVNTLKKINSDNLEFQNLVVVPDAFSMQAENLIFDVLKIKSTLNIEVVGISRLASKILRNNNIKFQRISKLEEIFNIYKVVKECESQFCYFHECGVDFCVKILQIIKQFKACKIKPEQIKVVGDDFLDRKMKDLRLIYEKYDTLMQDKMDLSKLLEFFLENVQNGLNLSKINLYFINFDSFSTEINEFVCKLASFVNEIYIGYAKPLSQGNAFIYEDDIFKKTTALAKECGVNVLVENSPTLLKDNKLKLVKNLFSFEIEEGKSDFFFNILAKNSTDEIEFVAKYTKHEVVNGKFYKNFAVAVADANYYSQVKRIFANYGISCYCDEAVNLTQTILGRFVLKIIQIAKLGFSKENLKFLANSPLLKLQLKEQILRDIDYFEIEDETELSEKYAEFMPIFDEIKNLKKCNKTQQFCLTIKNILEIVNANYQIFLLSMDTEKFFKQQSENAQSQELIQKVLDKLAELGKDDKLTLADFENLLVLSLSSVKVETIPTYIDAVYVGDVTESYFSDVDTLFVVGAKAGSLPKTQNDTGIIDDDDIKKLKLQFALEPEMKVLNRRNRLKLFEVLQHANSRLIVCQPLSEGGMSSQKAGFVNDLAKMFGENVVHTASLEDCNLALLSKEESLDKMLFFIGNVQNMMSAYTYLDANNKVPPFARATISQLIQGNKLKKDDALFVDKDVLKSAFEKKDTYSASQLESYFSCPFKHFVSYGLNVKPNENIEPNRRLFGIFEHALLKQFVEQNKLAVANLTLADIEIFLQENVRRIAQDVYDEKVLKNESFIHYLYNESKIILKNVVLEQKNSKFRPFLLEHKILDRVGDKNIIGFVDRIDKCGDYFRIIDYKTGKTENIKKDLFYGKKLQLFLYAGIVKNQLKSDVAGVYYFDCQTKYTKVNQHQTLFNGITKKDNEIVEMTDERLWQDNFKSNIIGMSRKKSAKSGEFAFKNGQSVENFQRLFEYTQKLVDNAMQEIEDGFILTKPTKDICKNCPYLSICKYSQQDGYRTLQSIKDENF